MLCLSGFELYSRWVPLLSDWQAARMTSQTLKATEERNLCSQSNYNHGNLTRKVDKVVRKQVQGFYGDGDPAMPHFAKSKCQIRDEWIMAVRCQWLERCLKSSVNQDIYKLRI